MVSRVGRCGLRVLSVVEFRFRLAVCLWLLVLDAIAHGRLVFGALPVSRREAAGETQT
jgi:hypothetical protein